MKSTLITVITIFLFASLSFGQEQNNQWVKYNFLLGTWHGEGNGEPGEGEGHFSFDLDLNENILIRKSHSEYPATKDKPLIIHDDLMIVYHDNSGNPSKAIYFDNEGHVLNYAITFPSDGELVFTSDKIPNAPLFRLTYSQTGADLINVKFEMSQDGEKFFTYVEGNSKRTK